MKVMARDQETTLTSSEATANLEIQKRSVTQESATQTLVNLIKKECDLDRISEKLIELRGCNISTPEVMVNLPAQWKHVATSCYSTPLRYAITMRRVDVVSAILDSACVIESTDLNFALQKILRFIDTQVDIDIVRVLISNGATVKSLSHLHLTLDSLLKKDQDLFKEFVATIIKFGNNEQLGFLLLALISKERNVDIPVSIRRRERPNSIDYCVKKEGSHHDSATSDWSECFHEIVICIFQNNFDPVLFMETLVQKPKKLFSSIAGSVFFALPLLLRLSTRVDAKIVGALFHKLHLFYPMLRTEMASKMKTMYMFLVFLGYDMKEFNNYAQLRAQFATTFGFAKAGTSSNVLTLKEQMRIAIRTKTHHRNMIMFLNSLDTYPMSLRKYLLLPEYYQNEMPFF